MKSSRSTLACLILIVALFFALPTLTSPNTRGQTTAPAAVPTTAPVSGPPCYLVMSSFPEELAAIEAVVAPDVSKLKRISINGIEFKSVDIKGRRFVFFLTGMSLVNAAMNTQMALDHFNVRAVFFSGIAGGIDPALGPGDVVVPANWHYHSEAAYLNEISPGKYAQSDGGPPKYANFGMIFPDDVTVKRDGMNDWKQMSSFPADQQLLAIGRRAAESLPEMKTGDRVNRVTIGGDGVSGTVFCDNADYRKWVFKVWKAECLDMESTAIAHVCWQNKKPVLIVRGLSDLAGGQAGPNEIGQYLKAAADHSAAVLARILQNLDSAVR